MKALAASGEIDGIVDIDLLIADNTTTPPSIHATYTNLDDDQTHFGNAGHAGVASLLVNARKAMR
jgi:hypothetical protein